VTYGEAGRATTLPGITEALLREKSSDDGWTCVSERLFFGPNMAARAESLVERHQPDVAVLYLSKTQFVQKRVVFRIRNRWPRLYQRSLAFAHWLKGAAGGGPYGATTARGWLYRAPLFLAERLIGTDPDLRVDDAIIYTRETVDRVAKHEAVTFLCKLPKETSGTPKTAEQMGWADRFRGAVVEMCASRHIPAYVSPDKETVPRRWMRRVTVDGVHSPVASRETNADGLAGEILAAVSEAAAVRA